MSSTPTESLTPYERLIFKSLIPPFFFGLFLIGWFVLRMHGLMSSRVGAILMMIAVLLIILRPFIVGPIVLHRTHSMSVHTDYEPVHFARDVVPQEVWDRIRKAVASLTPCGFETVAHFRHSRNVWAVGYVILLKNSNLITVARLITSFGTRIAGRPGQGGLVFITELADGTELATTNVTTLSGNPPRKDRRVLWMPEIEDPRELYKLHKQLVEKYGKAPKPFNLNGDIIEYMKQHSEAQMARWDKNGHYKLDSTNNHYRLTWKGATIHAWKHTWPIKPLHRAWRKHQTNKLLRKLEE